MYKALWKIDSKFRGVVASADWYNGGGESNGSYSQNGYDWVSCREEFVRWYINENSTCFYMSMRSTEYPLVVIRFIAKFEEKMRLGQRNRLKFIRYRNNRRVLKIVTSRWWMANQARRELLTILLRAPIKRYSTRGVVYKRATDFNKILKQCRYLHDTEVAVQKFIAGRRNLRDSHYFEGWVDTFNKKWGADPEGAKLVRSR